jgi:hypothetical protein
MRPRDQSQAYSARRYFAGKVTAAVPKIIPVGDPRPISQVDGHVSGQSVGQLPEPVRQPNSAPLTQCRMRVGRYHGAPTSHSMSESKVNSSPRESNAMS